MNNNFKIAKKLIVLAKELITDAMPQPNLYLLKEDGTVIPIVLPANNNVSIASKHNKHPKKSRSSTDKQTSLPQSTGKDIYLTPQAYEFYSQMDENNKDDFRKYCVELQTQGTLEGNPHAEKVNNANGVFAIRLTQGQSNDRFFYVYLEGNDVIVFGAYTKATRKIPIHILNKAKKDAKEFKKLSITNGLKPFNDILEETKDNATDNQNNQQQKP